MKYDLKGHNCFWVYQNQTFFEESNGGFLWSPKYTRDGKSNPGYEAMKEVHEGDIIFHSYMGKIVAIGKSQGRCYSAHRPGVAFNVWDYDGWKIDVEYFHLPVHFSTIDYRMAIYRIQPSNGPMRSDGVGKQQYLCNANQAIFDYIMSPILKSLTGQKQKQLIDFLDINVLFDPPNPSPKTEIINEIADGCKVDAIIVGENKKATLTINIEKLPNQKAWLGKKVGEVLKTTISTLSYRVEQIYKE